MKRKFIIIAAMYLCAGFLLPACDIFDECGSCEMVTVMPDQTETRTTPVWLCDENLAEKKDFVPITENGNTIYWECN